MSGEELAKILSVSGQGQIELLEAVLERYPTYDHHYIALECREYYGNRTTATRYSSWVSNHKNPPLLKSTQNQIDKLIKEGKWGNIDA